jgi:hypothetical protein
VKSGNWFCIDHVFNPKKLDSFAVDQNAKFVGPFNRVFEPRPNVCQAVSMHSIQALPKAKPKPKSFVEPPVTVTKEDLEEPESDQQFRCAATRVNKNFGEPGLYGHSLSIRLSHTLERS